MGVSVADLWNSMVVLLVTSAVTWFYVHQCSSPDTHGLEVFYYAQSKYMSVVNGRPKLVPCTFDEPVRRLPEPWSVYLVIACSAVVASCCCRKVSSVYARKRSGIKSAGPAGPVDGRWCTNRPIA